ncbi:cytochrome P450 [Phyllosticta citriasiana]|uniref:Cytochrome P450 n=1 Tax=Phyllosticta citriasiana TaxID=595635 RepID=A0ABR1KGE8_9PEZI
MTLHPLAGIPGPKLAAISRIYEAWWNAVKRGRYFLKYYQTHEDYGRSSTGTKRPVVRINPNEVHIRDPAYYEVLFSHNMKIDKDPFIYTLAFSDSPSAFATMEAPLHRVRRNAMSQFFSAKAIDRYEPYVQATFDKMIERLKTHCKTGEVVRITAASKAFAMDTVSHFTLGHSRNYLDEPDLGHRFQIAQLAVTSLMHWNRQSTKLVEMFKRLPTLMTDALYIAKTANEVVSSAPIELKDSDSSDPSKHISLIEFLHAWALPPAERTPSRLLNEAHSMLGVGVDTLSNIFIKFVYEILSAPRSRFYEPLLKELREAEAKLPYLDACVRESMRLIPTVHGRLPRVNPHEIMTYPATPTTAAAAGADGKGEKQQQ